MDYKVKDLALKPDYEGRCKATLLSYHKNKKGRRGLLYIHGFIDYFFQFDFGPRFDQQGFNFYALDLRKYGRSLMEHQHPNYCRNLREYFEEMDLAIELALKESSSLVLMGHSTGGLTSSLYMNEGQLRGRISALILNAPFLDFNMPKPLKFLSFNLSRVMSFFSNYASVSGAISPAYAMSVHKDYYGEWDFDLNWKPLKGFPAFFAWVKAINEAQNRLSSSDIQVPVLVLHSSQSKVMRSYNPLAQSCDIVLNVTDIKRVGADLGNQVELCEIQGAMHDAFLSASVAREQAYQAAFDWLKGL